MLGQLAAPGTFAATSLTALTGAISAAAKGSPSCPVPSCFSKVDVPPNSPLVAFTPFARCQEPMVGRSLMNARFAVR